MLTCDLKFTPDNIISNVFYKITDIDVSRTYKKSNSKFRILILVRNKRRITAASLSEMFRKNNRNTLIRVTMQTNPFPIHEIFK